MDLHICIIFVLLWGILVYRIALKLNTALELEVEKSEILKSTNIVLRRIHNTGKKNMETLNFIQNYLNNFYKGSEKKPQKHFIEKLEYKLECSVKVLHNKNDSISFYFDIQPLSEYEKLQRHVRQNTEEMWNYFSSELTQLIFKLEITNEDFKKLHNILELSAEYKRSLKSLIDQIRLIDGYETWRQREFKDISDLVQKRLSYIQNPVDCKNAKKLLCNLRQLCGYACQLHHIAYCLIVAYATERTMILKSKGWNYHSAGWEEIFQPVSETCTKYAVNQMKRWPGSVNTKVLRLPKYWRLKPRPSYLPLAIPKDLAPRLTKVLGDPSVWWISQFLKYILKPKYEKKRMLQISMKKLGWKRPIVGIHIRRNDKVFKEAEFHSIEEYMTYVEDYYLTLEMSNTEVERRVFLATDDPTVIKEARRKYPQYTILGDVNVANSADLSTRYSPSSLYGIISDIHMLSMSDYLVCTFSSNVCRMAYEIMQTYYPDAFNRIKSLDDIYYFAGQNDHNFESILSHKPRNKDEVNMKSADLFHVAGNQWNGFSKGKNRRTDNIGLYPSFKVKNLIETVKLPTYLNVN